MIRVAIINSDNMVEEVATWDETAVWQIPPGRSCVVLSQDSTVATGWKHIPTTLSFLEPAPQSGGPEVIRVEKIDFMRLFTLVEQVRYNVLKKQVAALNAQDYTDAMAGNQTKLALVQAEVLFDRFDLAEKVELTHLETIQGIHLLAAIGIFGTPGQDGATEESIQLRVSQVLSGHMPGLV